MEKKNKPKKPKRATKSQNEQPKVFACFGFFKTELILSQKQERATKSIKNQRTANGNTPQKPKRAKKQQRAFFIPIFIHLLQLWAFWQVVDIKSNEKPERVTTGNEKQ